MLFTVLLHVSGVTATETKAKRQAKLFPKHAFDFKLNLIFASASVESAN
jgi:hypothetical protein